MNTKKIETLLQKYYDGETTLQEEHLLKTFFLKEDIPQHLLEHKPLFVFFHDERKTTIPDPDFDRRLVNLNTSGRIIRMKTPHNRMMYLISLAASVVILLGLFFTVQNNDFLKSGPKTEVIGTITDADSAFTEISLALLKVSANLNTGIEQMQKISTFHKGFCEAQKLSTLNKYQPIIINRDDY